VTGSSAPLSEPQPTESYLRPPDEFDEFDLHQQLHEHRRSEHPSSRDRGMLRHGKYMALKTIPLFIFLPYPFIPSNAQSLERNSPYF